MGDRGRVPVGASMLVRGRGIATGPVRLVSAAVPFEKTNRDFYDEAPRRDDFSFTKPPPTEALARAVTVEHPSKRQLVA
jgi:hypothetical protein